MKKLMMVLATVILLSGIIGCQESKPSPAPRPSPKPTEKSVQTPTPNLSPTPTIPKVTVSTPTTPAPTPKPSIFPRGQMFSGKIQDPKGDTSFDLIDIIGAEIDVEGESVTVRIELANLPDQFIYNHNPGEDIEYGWRIFFDTDGNIETGSDYYRGAELNLGFYCPTPDEFLHPKGANKGVFDKFFSNTHYTTVLFRIPTLEETIKKGTTVFWIPAAEGFTKAEGNTLIIQCIIPDDIPKINSKTRWAIQGSRYEPNKKRWEHDDVPYAPLYYDEDSLKQQLAEKFAPILYLHPEEVYEPKDPRIMVENACLMMKPLTDKTPRDRPLTPLDLYNLPNSENFYLDLSMVLTEGAGPYAKKYKEIEAKYQTTVYARVTTQNSKTILQYWFFYFFNDGPMNNHEGDWELIQIILNTSRIPETISFSQHGQASTKKWSEMAYLENRPNVYVARGSHSNYFYPGEFNSYSDETWQPDGKETIIVPPFDSGLLRVLGRTVKGKIKEYQLVLLPEITEDKQVEKEVPWLAFKGLWGEWLPEPLGLFIGGPSALIVREVWRNPLKLINP